MQLTDEYLDLLFCAWALGEQGRGMVITDDAYPAAHQLAEAGWLERRFEAEGEMSWWWSPGADTALRFGARWLRGDQKPIGGAANLGTRQ